jgi:neutral ceramidase
MRSRAFIVAEEADPSKRIVFVNLDLGFADSGIRRGVIQRLSSLYPGVYDDTNVGLSGTHSHAGIGGYIENLLPQITSLGFVKETYDAIVEGTVKAIVSAHNSLSSGTLSFGTTDVRLIDIAI